MKSHIKKIFDQIDEYREFCVENGYPFNEADIGRNNTPWGHMQKSKHTGRSPYSQWIRDGNLMKRQASNRHNNR